MLSGDNSTPHDLYCVQVSEPTDNKYLHQTITPAGESRFLDLTQTMFTVMLDVKVEF